MKQMTWAAKRIALLQLNTQKALLERSLLQVDINLRPESSKEAWKFRDELRTQLTLLIEAMREIEETPCKKRRFYSRWIVNCYSWAVKDRFEF